MLSYLPVLSGLRPLHRRAASRRQSARQAYAEIREAHNEQASRLPASWDERGYLSDYPDVARAVLAGHVASGYAHWLRWGYAERRALPQRSIRVERARPPRAAVVPYWDEEAYLVRHPHVATLVALGLYDDGFAHCWALRTSQRPEPTPNTRWSEEGYLWMYPDVAEAVATLTFGSGFAHWFLCGLEEGREVAPVGAPPGNAVPGDSPVPTLQTAAERVDRPGAAVEAPHDAAPAYGRAPSSMGPSAAARSFAALAQHMRELSRT